ncbi:MAG TPA: hypothetical protein VNP04_01350 [Alphaproteobacteria bacterium]|nr:hypothetical protein [Alphaproteobacteria bacterium]
MTRDDLICFATRLVQGPVPTLEKKVYGYQGHITPLLAALPPSITVLTRVTDACEPHGLPTLAEGIPVYLREQLAASIRRLQASRVTSLIVIQDAALLARYRMPLPLLYELTGDSQAIILHLDEGLPPQAWTFPA